MKTRITPHLLAVSCALLVGNAAAQSNTLNIYTFTNYISPQLTKKFEKETGIKVNVDFYDTNESMLAKLKSGATSYDIVMPGNSYVPIMIQQGLLHKAQVNKMPNFKNLESRFQFPAWDSKSEYTVPWHWGTTAFSVNTRLYKGPANTLKELFEPNAAVSGKVGMLKSQEDMISLAQIYLNIPLCSADPKQMQKVQDLLLKQKPAVKVYSSEGIESRIANGEVLVQAWWGGSSLKRRVKGLPVKYVFPKEGILGWVDSLAIPAKAKNIDNAKRFINWMMLPANAALESNFTRHANGVKGSAVLMDAEMKNAPELQVPAKLPVHFAQACSPAAVKLNDKVWTRVLK